MAQKSKKKQEKRRDKQTEDERIKEALSAPWISMRTGIIVIAITSVVMTVLTAWQLVPSMGLLDSILWGLIFGGMIWVIFFGYYFFRRWLSK